MNLQSFKDFNQNNPRWIRFCDIFTVCTLIVIVLTVTTAYSTAPVQAQQTRAQIKPNQHPVCEPDSCLYSPRVIVSRAKVDRAPFHSLDPLSLPTKGSTFKASWLRAFYLWRHHHKHSQLGPHCFSSCAWAAAHNKWLCGVQSWNEEPGTNGCAWAKRPQITRFMSNEVVKVVLLCGAGAAVAWVPGSGEVTSAMVLGAAEGCGISYGMGWIYDHVFNKRGIPR